jgi:hypothetical protein
LEHDDERRICRKAQVLRREGVGQAFVLSRAPSVAHAAPVLRVLISRLGSGAHE